MKTALDIITEALEWQIQNKAREKQTFIERLLDFSGEKNADSGIIYYLSQRIGKEIKLREEAEKKAEEVKRNAYKCVEIYGPTAVGEFYRRFSQEIRGEGML